MADLISEWEVFVRSKIGGTGKNVSAVHTMKAYTDQYGSFVSNYVDTTTFEDFRRRFYIRNPDGESQ